MPNSTTISGKDVATRFAAVHVPYIQPGETRSLTPVALEAYQGGWQQGVDIYKAWREGWMQTPSLLCFHPDHGHRYGAPVYANDRKLIQNFATLSEPLIPQFLFAGEACYDWEFEAYHLSYHRSESRNHIPLSRYLLPFAPLATAVTGFDDRNMVNQCLMYRYIISYEPFYFKGRLDDFPLTLEYGKKMDALRTELRDYFWDGEFRHEVGAEVTADGARHHPYSVYIDRSNDRPGLVICNYEVDRDIKVQVQLEKGSVSRYRTVDDPAWRNIDDGIMIPARSAVVVI